MSQTAERSTARAWAPEQTGGSSVRGAKQIIERDDDLAVLRSAVDDTTAGRGSVVLLSGEAGIGKTTLMRAFLDGLPRHVRVLTGACDDLLAPPALGPLRDAFRGSGGPVETALATGATDTVFEALLTELSGAPAVLVVEDLHWADDTTVDLLRYAVRRLDRINAVLLLTFRPVDPRHPLRALLGELAGEQVRRIPLEPLSPAAVRSLSLGSERDADELYQLTRGNPFYLTEALAGPAGRVPPTVVDAVLARVRALDPVCLAVVEQLSVVPSHLSLDDAETLLGDRFDQLAVAEQSGVLQLHPDGIGFRHEIARRAVEHSLPVIRRRALNAELMHLLLAGQAHGDLSWLVHHAVEADDVATVLAYAPRAARDAARDGSHRQALAGFEAVLPYAARLGDTDRAELLEDYAWELHIAHRFSDSVRVGEEAIVLRELVGDPAALAQTLLRMSRHQYMAGDTAGAIAAVDRAHAIAGALDSPCLRASAAAYQAMMLALADGTIRAVEPLRRARVQAEIAGRTDLVALCMNYLGVVLSDSGDPRGRELLRDSLRSALASGDHESAARAYTNLAEVLYRQRLTDELEQVLADGLEFTRERGFWSHRYNLELHSALVDLDAGRWDDSDTTLRRLLDSIDDPGMLYVYSVPAFARLLARRGELDTAETLLAAAWDRAWQQRSLPGILYSALGYAEWAWLADRRDVAERIHRRMAEHELPPGLEQLLAELDRYLARSGVTVPRHQTLPRQADPYERALRAAETGSAETAIEALRVLDELGAAPAANRLRRRLRDLGVQRIPRGAQPATRNNPGGLTRRQLDVLQLLVAGLTNAEIADRLVLSVRTVDHHVSAILTKLGAATRREAAAAADDLGLLAQPA